MYTRNLTLALAMKSLGFSVKAFDPGNEKKPTWKLGENGAPEMKDGNPVYLDVNGNELTIGLDTIGRLNAEAKGHRERAEAAEGKLKGFDGIDPVKAKEAFDKLSLIDQKKLIDAGEVEKVRAEIGASFQTQLDTANKTNAELAAELDALHSSNAFGRSKWIEDNIAVPVDMLQAQFGKNFKRENGQMIAYDAAGQKIYSKKRAGELADFNEAIEILVNGYAYKEQILKGANNRGTGNKGDGGNGNPNARRITRSDFDALSPQEKADAAAKMRKGEMQLVDNPS